MKHEPRHSLAVELGGDLLALLACAALEATRFGSQWLSVPAGVITGCVVLSAFLVRWRLSRLSEDSDSRPALVMAVLFGFATIPTGVELAIQYWFGLGQAVEFHAAVWLRNLMLAMVATSSWRGHLRLAGLLSLFLVIFASSLAEDRAAWILTTVYGVVGVWWLTALYWSGLQGHFVAESRRRIPLIGQRRRLVPMLAVLVVLLIVIAPLLAGTALFGVSATTAINGWFSTSGGTGGCDPFARAGVNDGDALVRGTDDAKSVGPVESDVFLTGNEPSLYDLFNDMYGKPVKPKKLERSVALASPRGGPKREQKSAESKRLSREFSTLRNQPPKKKRARPNDLDSPALLYVAGRTPLHLRVHEFNTFDGTTWTSDPDPVDQGRKAAMMIQFEGKKPWLTTGLPVAFSQPLYSDLHVLKIVNLATNHIPAPAGLSRLHIDKIDQPDFFARAEGDVVRMNRERIPPFTVISTVSQVPSQTQLQELRPSFAHESSHPNAFSTVPRTSRSAEIAQLAKRWAGDSRPGWSQVAAVVAHLRQECQSDPAAVAPAGCDDSVAHFLFDSHRGPDYQFASASAILLRHLGYSTRVVSGFYAAPQNFDSRSQHTPVLAQDVHFWAEVELGPRWATVEATPGYEVLEPPATICQRCLEAMQAAWLWCCNSALSLTIGGIVMAGIVRFRQRILDALLQVYWRIVASRSSEACILATTWLLDRRCRWAGRARPVFITPARWYGDHDWPDGHAAESLRRTFPAMVNWYFYAPASVRRLPPAWTRQEVHAICRGVLRAWSNRHNLELRQHQDPTRLDFHLRSTEGHSNAINARIE